MGSAVTMVVGFDWGKVEGNRSDLSGVAYCGFVLIWVYFRVASGFLYLWGEWIRWNCGLQWGSILEDENASFSSSDPKFLVTCRAKENDSAITISAHSGHDIIHFLQ